MSSPRTIVAGVALALLLAAGSAPVVAQERQEYAAPTMDEMMAAYIEAGTPGEAHAMLAKLAGEWTIEVKSYMPGAPEPMVSTATVSAESVMGGRWLIEKVKGDFMGEPFEGVAITGYNNSSGMYENTWYDNMNTALFYSTGEMDGNEMTMKGTFIDPISGEKVKSWSVMKIVSDDERIARGYEERGGEEILTMELHYTRKM